MYKYYKNSDIKREAFVPPNPKEFVIAILLFLVSQSCALFEIFIWGSKEFSKFIVGGISLLKQANKAKRASILPAEPSNTNHLLYSVFSLLLLKNFKLLVIIIFT